MARTKVRLGSEVRMADYLRVGLPTQACPRVKVEAVLAALGKFAYPQVRFVGLLEKGTHVMFALALGAYSDSETTLFGQLIPRL